MTGSETRAIDSLMIEDFLDAKTCEGIIAEMEVAVVASHTAPMAAASSFLTDLILARLFDCR